MNCVVFVYYELITFFLVDLINNEILILRLYSVYQKFLRGSEFLNCEMGKVKINTKKGVVSAVNDLGDVKKKVRKSKKKKVDKKMRKKCVMKLKAEVTIRRHLSGVVS